MRRSIALLPLLAVGGCATIDDFLGKVLKDRTPVALEARPVEDPLPANEFVLQSAEQSVIGQPQAVFARDEDTFSDFAREYGLGYDEIVSANPGIDPWLPGENTPVILPTQYVLPDVPRQGLVLNIASKRLFYFPSAADGEPQRVLTYPIGIGRVGWETPLGAASVISKARNPQWWVPSSVRTEHAAMGDPLPAVVPAGPDNPLGTRVLKLDMPGYLIHGTNQPYGVGMRVSHGCVRLYPENIEFLYELVDVGESVMIINEPYLAGRQNGELYFEAHAPLEDDTVAPEERLQALFEAQAEESGRTLNAHLEEHIKALAQEPLGVPIRVAMYDANEVMSRVRVVHNTVTADPDEPTMLEVREMMNAAGDKDASL